MEQLVYKGFISSRDYGEDTDAIFIGDMERPIAEEVVEEINEKMVSVRYWISDVEMEKQQLQESFLKSLSGCVDAEYFATHGDYTGYLYHVANLDIGGHNLYSEIAYNIGKFIYLEIDVH